MPVPGKDKEEMKTGEAQDGRRSPKVPPKKGEQEDKGKKGRYRLLAGEHIGDNGEVHTKGNIVISHTDLSALFGAEKFQELSAPVKPQQSAEDEEEDDTGTVTQDTKSTTAPAGQVHSGKQSTTTLPGGETISGPEDAIQSKIDDASQQPDDKGKGGSTSPDKASSMAAKGQQAKMTPKQLQESHKKAAKQGDEDDYETYSVEELKKVAEEEEVDLKGAKTKEAIIKAIRDAS